MCELSWCKLANLNCFSWKGKRENLSARHFGLGLSIHVFNWWWCKEKQLPEVKATENVTHPMLRVSPSHLRCSQFIHSLLYIHLIHLYGLLGCLSVMCSLWCHKESFKYNLLKGKQCCPKHVMHPMLRASHSYLQSFEFILSTNKCLKLRCYGWQYAHNLYHLPHVTTLMGQAPIKQIFEGLPQKLIQRNHMVGFL